MPEPIVDIGDFAAGAVPPPIIHTFTDFNGVVVDLTTFPTVTVQIEAVPGVPVALGSGQVQITDDLVGEVTYWWHPNDMATANSEYRLQIWVWNDLPTSPTARRYESDLYRYRVYDGPGVAPS